MDRPYNILIMGASYGSLLAAKLLLAGHTVKLVCLPVEVELFNREGAIVRMPVKGRDGLVEIDSRRLRGARRSGSHAVWTAPCVLESRVARPAWPSPARTACASFLSPSPPPERIPGRRGRLSGQSETRFGARGRLDRHRRRHIRRPPHSPDRSRRRRPRPDEGWFYGTVVLHRFSLLSADHHV